MVFLKKIKNEKPLIVAVLFLVILISVIAVVPEIIHVNPSDQSIQEANQPPSLKHIFGTDKFGRDLFVRFLYGGRISLMVASLSVLLTLVIGIPYGLFSGYIGGAIDAISGWIINLFMSFPQFLLLLALVAVIGPGTVWWIIIIIAVMSWMDVARIVRNQTVSLKERDFILMARVLGFPSLRILFIHILPHLFTSIVVYSALMIGNVILLESALSFIGLGVQPPTPSWGNIINEGREVLLKNWWMSIFPGIGIVITVFLCNFIGDHLRKGFKVAYDS